MTIEVHQDSTSSPGMSPRISFSYNISPNDDVRPVIEEHYIKSSTSSSTIDFDFCVFRESFDQDESLSPADDLFFNGKILPIEIKKRLSPPPPPPPPPPLRQPQITHQTPSQDLPRKEEAEPKKRGESESEADHHLKPPSFWRFKRSASLNCGSGYARTLCPLPLLTRSNSAGTTAVNKRSPLGNNHKHQQKQLVGRSWNSNWRQPPAGYYHRKPPVRKGGVAASYGVKVQPVLNVSLFGILSYMFYGAKDKNKKCA